MPLLRLERLVEGLRKVRRVRGRRLLLIHHEGVSHVIEDRCPHMGAALARGHLDEGQLWCPKHGFCFDLASGRRLSPPVGGGGEECLERFEIIVRAGRLGVLLD
ncbi:MAG TPA: Rieske 2Fe-2S domain-containing protein [Pseudomonadales bacterium]|nr:Rieske 2Fe-2S domain-containing protein [Pseudomonadales bacterium]